MRYCISVRRFRRTNAVVLKQLLDLRKVKTWLDIGCGYGFLLKWLVNRGIVAEGVELSTQEADYGRAAGLSIHNSLLSETGLPTNHFDVVSSFEVVEHISDPRAILAEMAKYVRPGGFLVVMTDNFESAAVRKLRGAFPKWIPHTHVSHFGPGSLRACINGIPGLTIEKEAAYTPWDLSGRHLLAPFRPAVRDEDAFDLRSTLSTEMNKSYKLFHLRYFTHPVWTRLTLGSKMESGALMHALCRKQPA
jgi:SAM-dependent methyltransferase